MIAALDAMLEALLSESGTEVAAMLGEELGLSIGGEIASVAAMNPIETTYWLGQRAGPLLAEILISIVAGGVLGAAAVTAKRTALLVEGLGLEAIVSIARSVRRLPDLVPESRPELVPAGAWAPEADAPSGRRGARDEDRIARIWGEPIADSAEEVSEAGMSVRHADEIGATEVDVHLPSGTTVDQIWDVLHTDSGTWKPFAETLEALGIATQASLKKELEGLIGGPSVRGTVAVGTLRRTMKANHYDAIVEVCQKLGGDTLDAQHRFFLDAVERLKPSERGVVAERWYKAQYAPNAVEHGRISAKANNGGLTNAPDQDALKMRSDRVPDLIDGDALVEVKSHRGKLDQRSIDQVDDYLRALELHEKVDVTKAGRTHELDEVRVVFLDPRGGRENIRTIAHWLEGEPAPTIELFDSAGRRSVFRRGDADNARAFVAATP